jgi:hypothetical protein
MAYRYFQCKPTILSQATSKWPDVAYSELTIGLTVSSPVAFCGGQDCYVAGIDIQLSPKRHDSGVFASNFVRYTIVHHLFLSGCDFGEARRGAVAGVLVEWASARPGGAAHSKRRRMSNVLGKMLQKQSWNAFPSITTLSIDS